MNKTEFLNELEKKIRVLNKEEINDILAEYSQHIDMRMESGLSEDEAIKDFGDMDELAGEILEAYHVNPEFDKELNDKQEGIGKKAEALAEEITSSVGGPLKKLFLKCKELILRFFNWIKQFVSKIKSSEKIVFINTMKKKKAEEQPAEADVEVLEKNDTKAEKKKRTLFKKSEKKKENKKDIKAAAGRQIKKTKGRCRRLIGGFIALCVSVVAILCLIPTTIAMLFAVFGLGISVVMIFTGYPMAGIFVMLLGASVASIALWLLLASFVGIRRKNKNKAPKYEEAEEDYDEYKNAIDLEEAEETEDLNKDVFEYNNEAEYTRDNAEENAEDNTSEVMPERHIAKEYLIEYDLDEDNSEDNKNNENEEKKEEGNE